MENEELKGTLDTSETAESVFMRLLAAMHGVTNPVDTLAEVRPDVAYMRLLIVNVAFVGPAHAPSGGWALVDTGLPGSANSIIEAAKRRFGPDSRPASIVITHGHFDHVGAITDLLERWDVPVYAHESEIPFLTGKAEYVEPDPGVDAGMMAKMSPLYPRKPIGLGSHVQALPADGSVPGMPGWRWVYTPGHTPGHICLFRETDRVLIIGDAFTTTDQESAVTVMRQEKGVHGPPKYFTPDWVRARESVRLLADLRPSVVVASHGLPMEGEELSQQLQELARDFDRLAIPEKGKYVPKSHI